MLEKALKPSGFKTLNNIFKHENIITIIILIVSISVAAGLTQGRTLARSNVINVLLQCSTKGVASIGQAFVVLTSGIDLSIGGIGLFSSVLGASIMTLDIGQNIIGYSLSPVVAIPIMLAVGAGWGAINGLAVSRIGMPSLIATLAVWQITKAIQSNISGGRSVLNLPESLKLLGQTQLLDIPLPIILFFVIAVICYFVLHKSNFGKSIYMVGSNPLAAWLKGINVKNVIFLAHTISGLFAGIAAVILTSRYMAASYAMLSGIELDTIAAISLGGFSLIGGRGNLLGVVLGTIILGVINNSLSTTNVRLDTQNIVRGVIIFTAVTIDYWRIRRTKRQLAV